MSANSAMRKVSMRNLAAHRVRLLLTVISVLLGTAFVAGSFVFTDTLKGTFDKIFTTADKGVDARVQPKHDYDPGVPASLVTQIRAVPGVRAVELHADAPGRPGNSQGKKVKAGGAPSQGDMWNSGPNSVGPVDSFVSGRAPTRTGEVVINNGAAKKGHLTTGDRAKVVLPNAAVTNVTIVGVYHTQAETGGYIGVLFSQQQALNLFTDGTHVGSLDIAADNGVSQKTVTARIARTLPATLEVRTGDQARADDQDGIQTALSFINYILLGFGFIALIVGTFIIYNTFSMIVAQRLRELALLRAIGAARKQVRRSVLVEAAMIGLIGSALGLLGGVGLAYGLHALLDAFDLGLPSGGLVISPRTVIAALVVGTGVTLLSANAPARRAAKVPPVAAMREEFASTSAGSLRKRTIAGAALTALGAVATVGGALAKSGGSGASLIGLGLVGVAAGAMMLSPVLAGVIITPLGKVLGRPFGAVGRLARHERRAQPAAHRRNRIRTDARAAARERYRGRRRVGEGQPQPHLRQRRAGRLHPDHIDRGQCADPGGRSGGQGSGRRVHDPAARRADARRWQEVRGTGVDGPLQTVLTST